MSRKRRRPDRRRPFGTYAVRTPQPPTDAAGAEQPLLASMDADSGTPDALAPNAAQARAADPLTAAPVADPAAPELPLDAATSIGMRLRSARVAGGRTLEELARESRIPVAVLADIENDNLDRLGAPVFARGYLRGFARSVGVPETVAMAALDTMSTALPPLIATQHTSRSRYLASRYAPPVAYALLTLVVLVPLLTSLGPALAPAPRLEAIDAPVADLTAARPFEVPIPADSGTLTAQPDAGADASTFGPPDSLQAPEGASDAMEASSPPQQPMLASMTSMPEPVKATAGARRVVLSLTQQSWVEITGFDGRRIEYSLLPAGSVREYQIAGRAELRIGNSRAAGLEVDGRKIDLAAHTRLNVARVEVGGRQ